MTTYTDLPDQMRIFELAKRLDVPAGELMGRLNHLDIGARSVLQAIGRDDIKRVLEYYESGASWRYTSPDPATVGEMLDLLDREASRHNGTSVKETGEADEDASGHSPETPEPSMSEDDVAPTEEALETLSLLTDDDTSAAIGEGDTTFVTAFEEEPVEIAPEHELDLNDGPYAEDAADFESGAPEPQQPVAAGLVARIGARWRAMEARQRILAAGALIVLGTMLLTVLYALVRPTYAAESDVVITINGDGSEIERELQSFNVVASSQTVLAPVAEEFDMSVPDLRRSFGSEIVGDSTVLRLTTTAGSPEEALALNEALVASFLAVANEPLDQDELSFVAERIDLVTAEMTALDAELAVQEAEEASNAATRLQIESERDVIQAQLADLEGLLVDLRASGSPPAGSVTFVESRINDAEARLAELITEGQELESVDAATRSTANRLREERAVLRSDLREFQALQVDLELGQIAGNRVAVLAAGHMVDDPVGLTPTRAVVLGLLVGGALAFAWVVAATQLRRQR